MHWPRFVGQPGIFDIIWHTVNLVEQAPWDICRNLRIIVVHITGVWVLDVEASTGVITWSQVSELLILKPVQVSSRDHRWVSSWCWSQYRCHHVITGEWVLDAEASTGVISWSQVSEFLMLKPVQVSSRDHRWVSSWCWSQYRCRHVITGEWVLDVEVSTGVITWSQVSEFLMLKPVQVSSRYHRWVSSWYWSQHRCHHEYSWVNNLLVKMMTSSCLPGPAHILPDRSSWSSTSCMTSLVLTVALTPQEWLVPAVEAAEITEPDSSFRAYGSLQIYIVSQKKVHSLFLFLWLLFQMLTDFNSVW